MSLSDRGMLLTKVEQLREASGLPYQLEQAKVPEGEYARFGIKLYRKYVVKPLTANTLFTFLDGWVFGLMQSKAVNRGKLAPKGGTK